jgi:hypothetical protein
MVDLTLKLVHALHVWHFRGAACTNGGNDTVESSLRRIVDNPSSLFLVNLFHLCVESRALLQAVVVEELLHLGDNLFAVRVSFLPLDRGVETVHQGMDLQAGGVIDSLDELLGEE